MQQVVALAKKNNPTRFEQTRPIMNGNTRHEHSNFTRIPLLVHDPQSGFIDFQLPTHHPPEVLDLPDTWALFQPSRRVHQQSALCLYRLLQDSGHRL